MTQVGVIVLTIALDDDPQTGATQLVDALKAIDPPSVPRFAGSGTGGGARLVVEPESSTLIRWLDGDETHPFSPELGHHGRALRDLAIERNRQVGKGYTAEHDDAHTLTDLVEVAGRRIEPADAGVWPIDRDTLVEAAAVLVAAIESLDRRGT